MNWPLVAAIASFIAGLVAVRYWFRASQVSFEPFEEYRGVLRPLNPLHDPEHWVGAINQTLRESGRRNRIAAIWTAVSVFLSALAAVLSAFATPAENGTQTTGNRPELASFLWENGDADKPKNQPKS
jgi:hypothetical protein